jgi:uncharacterized protein YqjF (DUF2071 family)
MKKYLTAEWRDLVMVNYEVDAGLLSQRIPAGTDLDLNEGKCFVSLVGFMFLDTRVYGIRIPFHVNFEEVNLRFYVVRRVRSEVRRGVVFIKEIVPKLAISLIARLLYDEPYETATMTNSRDRSHIKYTWQKGRTLNSLGVGCGETLGVPAIGSHEEFIIEHYWGYTRRGETRTDEYKVEHPKWELYYALEPKINVDFGTLYGEEFSHLASDKPYSVVLAAGSEIAVYRGEQII